MERDKALGILKALADGIDPGTGEPFPIGSPYQHPDTVRALYYAVQALESPVRPRERSSQQKALPENAGRPWSEEEDARLAKAFDSGKSVLELAEEHKRSRIAIEARLVKLERMPAPSSGTMRYPVKEPGGIKGRGGMSSASDSARL
jgi:hypothetical protein